jgi:hypothetical protein
MLSIVNMLDWFLSCFGNNNRQIHSSVRLRFQEQKL